MENVLYNDLIRRGYDVDVGVVEYNCREYSGKKIRRQLEIDFVVNKADERCYIQSALSVADPEKKEQETASLVRIPDSFPISPPMITITTSTIVAFLPLFC